MLGGNAETKVETMSDAETLPEQAAHDDREISAVLDALTESRRYAVLGRWIDAEREAKETLVAEAESRANEMARTLYEAQSRVRTLEADKRAAHESVMRAYEAVTILAERENGAVVAARLAFNELQRAIHYTTDAPPAPSPVEPPGSAGETMSAGAAEGSTREGERTSGGEPAIGTPEQAPSNSVASGGHPYEQLDAFDRGRKFERWLEDQCVTFHSSCGRAGFPLPETHEEEAEALEKWRQDG
jgi:hypothetical protein